jgi:TonB family protein
MILCVLAACMLVVPSPDTANARDMDYSSYMHNLHRKIRLSWYPPVYDGLDRFALVRFEVHEDGSVSNLMLYQSSGREQLDKSALDAVTKASPFSTLPLGSPEMVQIEYKFENPWRDAIESQDCPTSDILVIKGNKDQKQGFGQITIPDRTAFPAALFSTLPGSLKDR